MNNIIKTLKNALKKEEPNIRDRAIDVLHAAIEEYSDWYEEHGLYLPPDYVTDPTSWTEALHKMKRAFTLLNDEANQEGELWEAKNKWKEFGEKDSEKIDELNREIKEGLTIFGSQLLYLTDRPKKVEKTH